MSVDTRVLTADELLRFPDDGSRYELVRGELRKMSPAGARHGRIAARIMARLLTYVEEHRLGVVYSSETGFVLGIGPDTVRAPDVGFVRTERVVQTDRFFPGPPDLAVEVLSPSDSYGEVAAKTRDYLRARTLAVVVVDDEKRTVDVHRSAAGDVATQFITDVLSVDDVVPGWKMTLEEIFAE